MDRPAENAAPEAENAPPPEPPDIQSPSVKLSQRRQAIAEKFKGKLSGVVEAATKAEEPAAEEPSADAAPTEAPETPAEPEQPEAAAEAEEATEPEAEEDKPKKPTAAEFAQLRKAKAAVAKRDREARRLMDEATKLKADMETIQREQAELNKLMAENPLEYMKRVSGGNVRRLFKAALEEEQVDEGEQRLRDMEAALKAQAEELAAYKKADEDRRRELAEASQKTEAQQFHERNVQSVRQKFEQHTTAEDFPYLHAYDKDLGARQVYAKVWQHYQQTGVELDLLDAFDQVNTELQKQVEPFRGLFGVANPAAPPARGNGAVTEPAKPEGTAEPATPPTLQATQTTARTVGDRKLTREERLKRSAALIRKAG